MRPLAQQQKEEGRRSGMRLQASTREEEQARQLEIGSGGTGLKGRTAVATGHGEGRTNTSKGSI